MKALHMKTQAELETDFQGRTVTLVGGATGLRGSLKCEARAVEGSEAAMDFIASDETLDRYDEVIKVDGWDLAAFKSNPVVVDCHDYSSITRILGKSPDIHVANGQLVNRVEFCLENPMGALAWKMAKGGFISSQSVGFIPIEWQTGKNVDQPSRTYTKQELLEVSLVVVPANPSATIGLALKSGAVDRADLRDLADFLKEFCSAKADPEAMASASGAGVFDAQVLRLARDLSQVLRRA